jgi:formylglycine-generating enzyme required for sulfatase activity
MNRILLTVAILIVASAAIFAIGQSTQPKLQGVGIDGLKNELRKPMPPQNEVATRDQLAEQKAEAAVRLFQLGRPAFVWPLLRHSPDPSVRSYLIHDLAAMNTNPNLIISRLMIEKDVSARRALILSLGEFTAQQLDEAERKPLIALLLRWYRSDADAGIHAAIGWLLRYANQGNAARKLNWDQAEALADIDQSLRGGRPQGRRWYVTHEGQTMVILRGPAQFNIGSPKYEPGRVPESDSPDEPLHRALIPRSFAISNTEVTVAQFQRFLDANPAVKASFRYPNDPNRMARVLQTFSPDADGPQIALTWYEAAMYCNWLSKQEGLPESEWVYPSRFDQIKDGMTMPKDYLHRTGYRMPTEAEWEYAARAGATTARFFGNSEELLDRYAWYSKHPPKSKSQAADPNDPQRTWPVGELKPNDFGLFDIYGNVWEWCQDRLRQYASGELVVDWEDEVLLISDKVSRSRRGGSFPYGAAMQRSAERDTINAFPNLRRDNVGFRVARTYR